MNRIIGVLWQKEKDGMVYFSGMMRDLRGDFRIAVFPDILNQIPENLFRDFLLF